MPDAKKQVPFPTPPTDESLLSDKVRDLMMIVADPKKVAIAAFKELNSFDRQIFLIQLIESGLTDFNQLSRLYVDKLQNERQASNEANAKLALFLGMYCGIDTSAAGKNARRLLYEAKNYTGADGSGFGKMLDDEFNPKTDKK